MNTQTLQRQFRLWTILLVLAPSLLIMAIYSVSQIKVAKQENLELISQRVQSQQRMIDYWIGERAENVRELSRTEAFQSLDEQQMKRALNLKQQGDSSFDSLSYIDKEGLFRISTFNGKIQYPSAIGKPYFELAKMGKPYISDVVVGRNSGVPIINFSSPIFNYAGDFQGVILGSIKTTTLETILQENWIGQTGEIFMVNRKGIMLTEPRHVNGLVQDTTKLKVKMTDDAVRNIRLGGSGTAEWIDYRGNKVLGAYLDVAGRNWTLIGKIDQSEVLTPIYQQLAIMAGGTLLLVLLIIPLAARRMNQIKQPIDWLIKQSDLIAASEDYAMADRDKYLGKMPQELAILCGAFIKMNCKIGEALGFLKENEAKLQSKVLEIQSVNTQLNQEILERQKVQSVLEKQIVREQLVATLSTQLASCKMNRLRRYIKLALASIGQLFNVNVSFVYLSCKSECEFRLEYYWCQDNTCWGSDRKINCLGFEQYPWLVSQLKGVGQLQIDAESLPADAIAECQLLHAVQIKSIMLLPMIRGSHLIGFLGLASLEERTIWQRDQATLMKVIGELVLNAVERQGIFQKLKISETDNRALVESIPDLMLRISSKGRVFGARNYNQNSLLKRIQLSGQNLATVFPHNITELYAAAIAQALMQGKLQIIEYDIVDNGVARYCEARIVPTRGNTVLAVIRDITEQKRMAEALANVRDTIVTAQNMASLGVMAGSIAHEINQPLNSIKVSASGMLYLMQKEVALSTGDLQRELLRIVDETERIEQVISKKRWIGRAGLLCKEPVLIDEAVFSVLSLIKNQDLYKSVRINLELMPQKAWVLGNQTQIEQILFHLLTNAAQALEATDQLDKVINISVQVTDKVILSVADNGPGMESATLDKIFEPFFTTGRAAENMGLGLAIVQSITYAYGGEIIAENNQVGGATFSVSFPLIKDLCVNGDKLNENYVS
jgi:PAS domain S-box-containing protein